MSNYIKISKHIISFKDPVPNHKIVYTNRNFVSYALYWQKRRSPFFSILYGKLFYITILYAEVKQRNYFFPENIVLLTSEFN